MKKILVAAMLLMLAAGCNKNQSPNSSEGSSGTENPAPVQSAQSVQNDNSQNIPILNAASRITKKPFGIKVSPQNSPVQPERFSGYHTGTDFETTPGEKGQPVPVYAICDGKILERVTASGYGGVIVESCDLENHAVTIIYGHINYSSSSLKAGDMVKRGDQLAILGEQGPQTDGERKHLHLGIHKGTTINIKGYVQTQAELSGWLDYQKLPPF